MKTNSRFARKTVLLFMAALVLFSGPACAITLIKWPGGIGSTPEAPTPALSTATPLPMAQVIFHAALPAPLAPNETLSLRVLDEVSGLGFNYTDYPMSARDALNYVATLPLAVNSVVKYRYIRIGGNEAQEYIAFNQPIRYRLYYAIGPSEVTDLIAAWPDRPFNGATGSVQGSAVNADSGTAIPNLLVSAGGIQAITDSAGRFVLPTGSSRRDAQRYRLRAGRKLRHLPAGCHRRSGAGNARRG
jgi:hypothetical protein